MRSNSFFQYSRNSQSGHFESFVLNFPGIRRSLLPTYSRIAHYTAQHGVTTLCNGRLSDDLKAASVTICSHITQLTELGLILPIYCRHGNNMGLRNGNRGAARWLLTQGAHFRKGFIAALDQCVSKADLWYVSSQGTHTADDKQMELWRFLALQERMYPTSTQEAAAYALECGVKPPVAGEIGTCEFNQSLWNFFDKRGEMPALKDHEKGRSSNKPKGPGASSRKDKEGPGATTENVKEGLIETDNRIEFLPIGRNRIRKQGTPTRVAGTTRETPTQTAEQFGGSNFSFENPESIRPEASERAAAAAAQTPGCPNQPVTQERIVQALLNDAPRAQELLAAGKLQVAKQAYVGHSPEVAALFDAGKWVEAHATYCAETTGLDYHYFGPVPVLIEQMKVLGLKEFFFFHPEAERNMGDMFAMFHLDDEAPVIDPDKLTAEEFENYDKACKAQEVVRKFEKGIEEAVASAREKAKPVSLLRSVATKTSAGVVRCGSRLGRLLGCHVDAEDVVAGLENFLGPVTKWPRMWQVNLRHRLQKNEINLRVFESLRANMDSIMSWKNLLVYDVKEKIDNFKIAMEKLKMITGPAPVHREYIYRPYISHA